MSRVTKRHCSKNFNTFNKVENIGSQIDMRAHAGCNWYPFNLDLLNSRSMLAERLLWSISVPSLVLKAQAV